MSISTYHRLRIKPVFTVTVFCIFVGLAACRTYTVDRINEDSDVFGQLVLDSDTFRLRAQPYINAMPGSNSTDIIIPIIFEQLHQSHNEQWNYSFKLTHSEISLGGKVYYSGSDFDHQDWMDNTQNRRNDNVLRIPEELIPLSFTLTLNFMDSKNRKYRCVLEPLGPGYVY